MTDVVTALVNPTTGITASTFTTQFSALVPFIVMILPVGLGLVWLRRLVNNAGKGKMKI